MRKMETMEMDRDTLKQLRRAWQEEQARLWREFKDSLTPEQRQLFARHRRCTAVLAKLRRWERQLAQGRHLRGKRVDWPPHPAYEVSDDKEK